MVDLHIRDLTKLPDDPDCEHWMVLENREWDKVKWFIDQELSDEEACDYHKGLHDGYQKGREDTIAFFKSLIIRDDEDYDKPAISMKFLNDYIEQMIVDGFGEQIKEQKNG